MQKRGREGKGAKGCSFGLVNDTLLAGTNVNGLVGTMTMYGGLLENGKGRR